MVEHFFWDFAHHFYIPPRSFFLIKSLYIHFLFFRFPPRSTFTIMAAATFSFHILLLILKSFSIFSLIIFNSLSLIPISCFAPLLRVCLQMFTFETYSHNERLFICQNNIEWAKKIEMKKNFNPHAENLGSKIYWKIHWQLDWKWDMRKRDGSDEIKQYLVRIRKWNERKKLLIMHFSCFIVIKKY